MNNAIDRWIFTEKKANDVLTSVIRVTAVAAVVGVLLNWDIFYGILWVNWLGR